ncbi:Flp pilus assembly protein CpaB [Senegalimassilia anaerobia]
MRRNKTAAAGAICGVLCALCVLGYTQSVRGEAERARADVLARYGGDQVEVCVAKRDIAAGETVDSGAVETRLWVADLLPPEAVRQTSEVVGSKASSTVLSGEVLSARRFGAASAAIDVPDGKVAISVPAKDVQAVGGAVSAGSSVDVYATGSAATQALAQGVSVLATSAGTDDRQASGSASKVTWVTLAVDPNQVEELVSAAQKNRAVPDLARRGCEVRAVLKQAEGEGMSMPLVALCADEECFRHPELLGLEGENLLAQQWLMPFTSAEAARAALRDAASVQEVWVVSCTDVAPINLAAALKRDRVDRRVCMLTAQESGSLRSRTTAAGVDASLTRQAFVERYAQCKQAAMRAIELQAGIGPGAGCAPAGEAAAPQQAALGNAPSAASPYGTAAMPTAGFSGTFEGAAAPAVAMAPSAGVRPGGSYAPANAQTGLVAPSATKAFAATASPYGTASGLGASGSSSASAANAQHPAAKGFLLPVVSGSGGAGKSAVALLAAHAAQGLGLRTLLLDFDLQFGDMAQLMGVKKPLRIDEVLARPERLGQLACEGKVPALLAAPEHVDAAEAVVAQAPALLDAVRERFDVIVANTGGAWAEQHAVLLERSSKALFLVDQRATSVHATQRALDLCARCGIAVNPFLFTLNGCGKGAPLSSMDVSCALKGAHVHELPDGGADVEELLAAGLVVDLIDSRNDLFEGVEELMAEILPGVSAAAGSSREGPGMPFLRGKRSRKRKKA